MGSAAATLAASRAATTSGTERRRWRISFSLNAVEGPVLGPGSPRSAGHPCGAWVVRAVTPIRARRERSGRAQVADGRCSGREGREPTRGGADGARRGGVRPLLPELLPPGRRAIGRELLAGRHPCGGEAHALADARHRPAGERRELVGLALAARGQRLAVRVHGLALPLALPLVADDDAALEVLAILRHLQHEVLGERGAVVAGVEPGEKNARVGIVEPPDPERAEIRT